MIKLKTEGRYEGILEFLFRPVDASEVGKIYILLSFFHIPASLGLLYCTANEELAASGQVKYRIQVKAPMATMLEFDVFCRTKDAEALANFLNQWCVIVSEKFTVNIFEL